ncbi:MAG TPA: hypothetical protein PK733_12175 [Clostridiales bacterium]|nr:hypothetical protein [Clostridiales bacterium]
MRIPRKFGERTAHFGKTQDKKRKYVLAEDMRCCLYDNIQYKY